MLQAVPRGARAWISGAPKARRPDPGLSLSSQPPRSEWPNRRGAADKWQTLLCRPSRPDSRTEFSRSWHVAAGFSAELLAAVCPSKIALAAAFEVGLARGFYIGCQPPIERP